MPAEVAIIGAGPAGLAAAIQLARYGLKPLVFEKAAVGGLLRNANLVENYPGFPRGISGWELARLFAEQAEKVGVQIRFEEAITLGYENERFQICTERSLYETHIAVVATGTSPRQINGLSIPASLDDRFFYEVFPLLDLHACRVAIIGAGDAAFDYALNLSRLNTVDILNRGTNRSCLPLLWERASSHPSIHYHEATIVAGVRADPASGMLLECRSQSGDFDLKADYLIAAVGRDPQDDFLSTELKETRMELESKGVLYFIGDIKNGIYRQTSIAAGEGILAAMKIYHDLREREK